MTTVPPKQSSRKFNASRKSNGHSHVGTRFATAPDSWELRLRIALRFGNGAVFTARQCQEIAAELGWEVRAK